MYAGLTGSAKKSMQQPTVSNNFYQAAEALRSKFPWIPYAEEPEKTVQGIIKIRQESEGLENYINKAIRLRPFIEEQDFSLL